MLEYLVPLFLILLGIIGLTIYILVTALKESTKQITQINEQLLIMLGIRDGGEAVGRALVASAKLPRREIGGISGKKEIKKEDKAETPKPGLRLTVGSR